MTAPKKDLAQALRVSPAKLQFLAPLSDDERSRLTADVQRALELHATHVRRAMAEALNHIPWILRAPVKAIFR